MKKTRLIRRAGRVCRGGSRGFTLIEIVIAIALVGIIAVAILNSLSTASLALILADERATAESLARSQMEYTKNSPYDLRDPPQYPLIDIPDGYIGYSIEVDAVRLDPEEDGTDDDDGIQKITVTVSRNDKMLVTLENYKLGTGE
jgi:prepilin-type N-terminal cleavage/methylation domain-containing protein